MSCELSVLSLKPVRNYCSRFSWCSCTSCSVAALEATSAPEKLGTPPGGQGSSGGRAPAPAVAGELHVHCVCAAELHLSVSVRAGASSCLSPAFLHVLRGRSSVVSNDNQINAFAPHSETVSREAWKAPFLYLYLAGIFKDVAQCDPVRLHSFRAEKPSFGSWPVKALFSTVVAAW